LPKINDPEKMTLNFFTVLTLISIFLTALLTLFFLLTPRGERQQNIILSLLLMVFGIQIAYSFCTSTFAFRYFMDWHKEIFLMRQTTFLIGPLIYFYVTSFLKRDGKTDGFQPFHLLPFLFAISFLLLLFRHLDQFVIWESDLDLYDTVALLTSNFIYLFLTIQILRPMKTGLTEFVKTLQTTSPQSWTNLLLVGFIVLWLVNLNSFALFMVLKNPGWCAYTASIYALVAFLFLNVIVFIILFNPEIYYVILKYKSNPLKEKDKADFVERIERYMEENKPYLNPTITLESLAKQVEMNPRILSQIINDTYQRNFKGYILDYRLRESMKILKDPGAQRLTILEILYHVGFNSKSAFNNQFKIRTNLTPQEYRAQYLGRSFTTFQGKKESYCMQMDDMRILTR
jgi:AraC-like DNA-binding protein